MISTRIPDTADDERLGRVVKKSMIHGPCSSHNLAVPCMVPNSRTGQPVYSKGFPKRFLPETLVSSNGYTSYVHPHEPHQWFTKWMNGKPFQI